VWVWVLVGGWEGLWVGVGVWVCVGGWVDGWTGGRVGACVRACVRVWVWVCCGVQPTLAVSPPATSPSPLFHRFSFAHHGLKVEAGITQPTRPAAISVPMGCPPLPPPLRFSKGPRPPRRAGGSSRPPSPPWASRPPSSRRGPGVTRIPDHAPPYPEISVI